ncbi:hypothetical protein BGX38DRAFT_397488 [Terfezia claveryi]|nr:hypothetical protein BGX38DRAFT_397488 [Terfezia claveryi]
MRAPMHQQHRTPKTMANVGYQEKESWSRPKNMIRDVGGFYGDDLSTSAVIIKGDKKEDGSSTVPGVAFAGEGSGVGVGFGAEGERVEYDMDEQDDKWLTELNANRRLLEVESISREIFEITMTKIEKEWCSLEKQIPKKPPGPKTPHPGHSHRNGNDGDEEGAEDSKCAICDDGECENSNAIVFCDGCDLAVHQDCYGVPYIPEGQWLCRKCLNSPRQVVNCILCPNMDGAFKQTVTNAWAHLLCAMWIPEVVIGNQSFMEPIDGIEDIPKQRWKLTCYICRQRMGACIQCSNKNCFVAFHVTCARRARLFLKMKSSGGGLEFNNLKGFCDRHVPTDWRRENDVENAILDAQEFYAASLSDSMWRESQLSGLEKEPESQQYDHHELTPANGESSSMTVISGVHQGSPSALAGARRRKTQLVQNKVVWKLPSGAPVIPQIVFNAVCDSIARFGVRKRKEYVAEVCKYWTLKREARRGAALIKRLQLPESSSELTRRNWKAISQGRKKLLGRVAFATELRRDVEQLRLLADEVKRREREKLRIAGMMRDYVEKVYFPEVPLMQPIFEKAQSLDKGDHFKLGFSILGSRLHDKIYFTIDAFYNDLTAMLQSRPLDPKFAYSFPPEYGIAAPSFKPLIGRLPSTDDDDNTSDVQALRTANRILKMIAPFVEEAKKKEDDLRANPYAVAAKELEDRLEKERGKVRTGSRTPISPITTNLLADKMEVDVDVKDETRSDQGVMVAPLPKKNEGGAQDDETMDVDAEADEDLDADGEYEVDDISLLQPIPDGRTTNSTVLYSGQQGVQASITNGNSDTLLDIANHTGSKPESVANPAVLLNSAATVTVPFPQGSPSFAQSPNPKATAPCSFPTLSAAHWNGKHPPWYLQEFDPKGLVLHEERWLGRDIARESSPLSELSEDEMLGLVGEVGDENNAGHARLPGSLLAVPAENGNLGIGVIQDNTLTRDILESNRPARAESSSLGRSRLYRGKFRRGRFRGRGRGKGVASRGGSRAAEIEVDGDAEDFQGAEIIDDVVLVIDEQPRTEMIDPPKNTSSSAQTDLKAEPAAKENISTELDQIPPADGNGNDDMDIDTPQLPSLPTQQSPEDIPQTPRTSSLSPLTSVVADFDSSPLSNPPTRLSQRDQSPSRYRRTSAGSHDTGKAEDYHEDEEGSIQNHSNPNTPHKRSRKNMVFARQSNGRFGSNKGGAVVASSSVKKKRSKRWI